MDAAQINQLIDLKKGINKVVRDGQVAVLVSYGFGAGWSTWCYDEVQSERMLFDPVIIGMLEEGVWTVEEVRKVAECRYPGQYFGGLRDVGIEWVPVGTRFIINEYDGSETLEVLEPTTGYVA